MFTFGLFSTHMPYVVMVVFYGLYFLFTGAGALPITSEVKIDDPKGQPEQIDISSSDTGPVLAQYHAGVALSLFKTIPPPDSPLAALLLLPPEPDRPYRGFIKATSSRPPPLCS